MLMFVTFEVSNLPPNFTFVSPVHWLNIVAVLVRVPFDDVSRPLTSTAVRSCWALNIADREVSVSPSSAAKAVPEKVIDVAFLIGLPSSVAM